MEHDQFKQMYEVLHRISLCLETIVSCMPKQNEEMKEDYRDYLNLKKDTLLKDFKEYIDSKGKIFFEEKDFVALGLKNFNRLFSIDTLSDWFKEFVFIGEFRTSSYMGRYTLKD